VSTLRPDVPPELEEVITLSLALDVKRRPATAEEMGERLDALVGTAPSDEREIARWMRTVKARDLGGARDEAPATPATAKTAREGMTKTAPFEDATETEGPSTEEET
jgi:hypothetical protein